MLAHATRCAPGVAIIGHGRCGTTWLYSLIRSHPLVIGIGEEAFQANQAYDTSGANSPREFLESLLEQHQHRTIAFKYLNPAIQRFGFELFEDFKKLDIRLLHIYRSSIIEVYLSRLFNNSRDYRRETLYIDRKELETFIQSYIAFQKGILDHSNPSHRLSVRYEDLRVDRFNHFRTILDFLQLTHHDLLSPTTKRQRRTVQEIVTNYDEIADLAAVTYP